MLKFLIFRQSPVLEKDADHLLHAVQDVGGGPAHRVPVAGDGPVEGLAQVGVHGQVAVDLAAVKAGGGPELG